MKKALIAITLFFCCITARSQSIGLLDLTNLTSLKSEQIESYFSTGKLFKLQYGEDVAGYTIKHWQTYGPNVSKVETVLTGSGFKVASGAILYTVSYVTSDPQNIINLINQTKNVGLKLTFQGADPTDNIYIYDSALYHVVFKLNFAQTKGTLDISQKPIFAQ